MNCSVVTDHPINKGSWNWKFGLIFHFFYFRKPLNEVCFISVWLHLPTILLQIHHFQYSRSTSVHSTVILQTENSCVA
jgi:hypothetical protein